MLWVLLKDVAATLLQAIKLIREAGLRHSIPQATEESARQMNQLCLAMTHSRRRRYSRKERKKILSVYESGLHVIVWGKEVEFGNTLLLCESAAGYLLVW